MNYLTNYLKLSMLFGAAHKVSLVWNGTIEDYSIKYAKKINRELLIGEKLGILCFGMYVSPCMAPIWLFNYINKFEIALKNKDPSLYGYEEPKHFMQYVFS